MIHETLSVKNLKKEKNFLVVHVVS